MVLRRFRPLRIATVAWGMGGICWLSMGLWQTLVGVALTAAVGGAFLVCGIAAINAVITRETRGARRRTLLSAQSVVVTATSSLGTLVGGVILAACGVTMTLVVSGALLVMVAIVAGWPAWRRAPEALAAEPFHKAGESQGASVLRRVLRSV
jgi:MFS family permease